MSSIIIKGLEMPTSCRTCPMKMNCDDCEGWECVCVPLHKQIGYFDDLLTDKRRDDCPIVPVPTHGRLGDLDKLALEMMDAANVDQALAMLDDAPTIIPASEEGE